MSTANDSRLASLEVQDNHYRQKLKSQVWWELRTILNWMLVAAVLFFGIWVLILKMSPEPGVHLRLFNETGQKLKDVKLTFTWSEYVMPELPAERREKWLKPYGAIIQRVGFMEGKATTLTIQWIDDKGSKHQHIEKDLYLGIESLELNITFHSDGTVTVKLRGLSFFI